MIKMAMVILFCLASFLIIGTYADDAKIIGGENMEIRVPYIASLRTKEQGHVCSGVIRTNRYIITTRKCALMDITVAQVGSNILSKGGVFHKLNAQKYFHPNPTVDLALVKSNTTMIFNQNVNNINIEMSNLYASTKLMVTGWGSKSSIVSIYSDNLQILTTGIISTANCKIKIGPTAPLASHELCTQAALGKGICFGDFGSPLVRNNKLYAIASRLPTNNCVVKNIPDISVKLAPFSLWIDQTIIANP